MSALLLRRKNGDSTHGHSGALHNGGQKVMLMVTVKEILDNVYLNDADNCHEGRLK